MLKQYGWYKSEHTLRLFRFLWDDSYNMVRDNELRFGDLIIPLIPPRNPVALDSDNGIQNKQLCYKYPFVNTK